MLYRKVCNNSSWVVSSSIILQVALQDNLPRRCTNKHVLIYLVCFIVQADELILAALLRENLPNKSIRKFRIDRRVIAPSGVQLIRNRVKTTRRSCYNLSLSILLVWKINAYHYTQPTCTPNKRFNICFCDSLVKEYFTSLLKKFHKLSGKKPNKKMCTLQIISGSENQSRNLNDRTQFIMH